ncbi:uncharacterized protein LOC121735668 [Aricia agestis]|uniref:uncharacterized protein LOC121735668 n=1 Tax=Aricia agestis TaxID=91739 RepID=UPI001C2018EA|nr:uncharacterized protein LOC121735668 [Aricia agestis]
MAVIKLPLFDIVPVRFNLWIMIFTACWVSYMIRVNMSLNLIAMVPQTPQNMTLKSQCSSNVEALRQGNETLPDVSIVPINETTEEVSYGTVFNWTKDQQATILGAYFWSYPVTSLIGGTVAERWGPRYVVFWCSVLGALLTVLSPAAASLGYIALVLNRFVLGITGGFIYPALHVLVARWAPPAEKGKFTSALMGGVLGTVVTWSVTGPLMENYGWSCAFYVPGALCLVWCALWWYLVADRPTEHPRIAESERKYIMEALGDKIQKTKVAPPFKKIFMSFPFLAMTVLHFGNLWGLYFIMTVGPQFVSKVLGFQLSSAGFISALPYLARLICAAIFGAIGDCILSRKMMSTTAIRKFFCLFSHILPGVLLILLMYTGCSTALSVAMITMSMGFNGAATLTNLQNHQDLAPNFAGTLYGIANFVGSTSGFFSPMITAYFTRTGDTFTQWRPVFYIGASVYIVSAVFFMMFGTGQTQSWNFVETDDEEKNGKGKDMTEVTNGVNKNDKPVENITTTSTWMKIRIRAIVGIMIFFGYFLIYVTRYNIAVHIVDMVDGPWKHKRNRSESVRKGHRAESLRIRKKTGSVIDIMYWSESKISLLLAAYHLGYCTCFPIFHNYGDRYGPTRVVGVSGFVSGLLNCLTPASAYYSYWVLFLFRVIIGFCAGAMQPSMVQVLRHWVPPTERHHFMWAYCGYTLGTCCTFLLCAAVQYYSTWCVGFYLSGAAQVTWSIIWLLVVTDSPNKHSFISDDERIYLSNTISNVFAIKLTNSQAPWKLILKSVSFWAVCILSFGYSWILVSLCLHGPLYYSIVLRYSIYEASALTALPFLIRLVLGTSAIQTYHWYKNKYGMHETRHIIKYLISVSHVIPGGITLLTWSLPLTVSPYVLTTAIALTAAGMDLPFNICYELSPNYFNSIITVIKIISNVPGIIIPICVGEAVKLVYKNEIRVWKSIWCIHGLVLLLSGLVFMVFGDTDIQPWNDIRQRSFRPRQMLTIRPSTMSAITEADEDELSSTQSSIRAVGRSQRPTMFKAFRLSSNN